MSYSHELVSSKGIDTENEIESTKIILTPIKASPRQQRKHKCDYICKLTNLNVSCYSLDEFHTANMVSIFVTTK